jgi:outer membrane lipoprotein-sorting protein
MEYVSPARIKGMKMLMLNDGDDIWVYFPRTARVRKIASHQKKQSVNNSDFSYEDLSMRDNRKDYHCTLAGEETKDGAACYNIVMKAKDPEKTYQRIVMWVDKESFVSVAAEYFGEDGQLWKQLAVDDVTRIGDYWTAGTIEMKDVQKGSRTVMKMDKIEYDIQLDESMFSERYLKK